MLQPYSFETENNALNKLFAGVVLASEMHSQGGAFYKMRPQMGKSPIFGEDRLANIAIEVALGGGEGTNLAVVDSLSGVATTKRYQIPAAWFHTRDGFDLMDAAIQRQRGVSAKGQSIESTAARMAALRRVRSHSFFAYQDQTRRFAKVKATASSTITVYNGRGLRIVAEGGANTGDRIVACDASGVEIPGTDMVVLSKSMEGNTLTMTAAIPAGVVADSYLKKKGDTGDSRPFLGVLDFIPNRKSVADATTTRLGLDVSLRSDLQGLRIPFASGESARALVNKVKAAFDNNTDGGMPDTVLVTPDFMQRFKDELLAQELIVQDYKRPPGKGYSGYTGLGIVLGDTVLALREDKYLVDIEHDRTQADNPEHVGLFTRMMDHRHTNFKLWGPWTEYERAYSRQLGEEVAGKTIGEGGASYMINPINTAWFGPGVIDV